MHRIVHWKHNCARYPARSLCSPCIVSNSHSSIMYTYFYSLMRKLRIIPGKLFKNVYVIVRQSLWTEIHMEYCKVIFCHVIGQWKCHHQTSVCLHWDWRVATVRKLWAPRCCYWLWSVLEWTWAATVWGSFSSSTAPSSLFPPHSLSSSPHPTPHQLLLP